MDNGVRLLLKNGWRQVNHGFGWQYKDETKTHDYVHARLRLLTHLQAEQARREYNTSISLVDPDSFFGKVLSFFKSIFERGPGGRE